MSEHSEEALANKASAYREYLAKKPTLSLHDLCANAAREARHGVHRLALVASSHDQLASGLADSAEKRESNHPIACGQALSGPKRVAFVFPGQGSQWLGMARQMLVHRPVFRATMERIDQAMRAVPASFDGWDGWDGSLLDELAADQASSQLDRIDVVQPLLFAVQVAYAREWMSWGITPDGVVGHSMGEVAAAYIAGALDLRDAVAIICQRSRLMRRQSGKGSMAVVGLSMDEARAAISRHENELSIAVNNGPRTTVLSGNSESLDQVLDELEAADIFCCPVKVDVASHSPQMEPLLPELGRLLSAIPGHDTTVPMYSTVTGQLIDGLDCRGQYWLRNLRQPVRFGDAMSNMLEAGFTTFIEMSPHPVLVKAMKQCMAGSSAPSIIPNITLVSGRRDENDEAVMLETLARLFVHGHDIYWPGVFLDPEHGTSTRAPSNGREANLCHEAIAAGIREQAAEVLKQPANQLAADRPLHTSGLSSLEALELRQRLERTFQLSLPVTLIFNHPTLAALTAYLARKIETGQTPRTTAEVWS